MVRSSAVVYLTLTEVEVAFSSDTNISDSEQSRTASNTLPSLLRTRLAMGGSAFSAGPDALFTPRMPKAVYETAKTRCHALLLELYSCVASPIEGPAKADFGDIDILVAWPKRDGLAGRDGLAVMAQALGAARVIEEKGPIASGHLAIPWPPEHSQNAADLRAEERSEGELRGEWHIQVDVKVCGSLQDVQWALFHHAHGDMWNILSSIVRPYGLTVDDTALWLRIPEVEAVNRKRAKVLLTRDPVAVLHFLGLPVLGFWEAPLDAPDALYSYAARCRLFCARPPPARDGDGEGAGTVVEHRRALKSNDRRRMAYRPVFRRWIEEFLPQCREQGRFLEVQTTREQVTEEALDRFHVRAEYTSRRAEFLLETQRDATWRLIKASVPAVTSSSNPRDMTYQACLIKALRNIIMESDTSYGIQAPAGLRDQDGFFVTEKVMDFVAGNRDEIGRLAYKRHHEAFLEHKERLALKGGQV